jgi:hypothetical protein
MREQRTAQARIFASYEINMRKRPQSPQGYITEIADGGCDNIKAGRQFTWSNIPASFGNLPCQTRIIRR